MRRLTTPNKSKRRRSPADITLGLVHYTGSPNMDGSVAWFQDSRAKVSAHYIIGTDGDVAAFEDDLAWLWHAGKSSWQERDGCNAFSIGYELVGTGEQPFLAAQYASLRELLVDHLREYPIDSVVGHQHVSPGRKVDPGPFFEWGTLLDGIEYADSVKWLGGERRTTLVDLEAKVYDVVDAPEMELEPSPMQPGVDMTVDRKGYPLWHPRRWRR